MQARVLLFLSLTLLGCQACVGQVIGVTTDAAIAVAKVPFKVGGAVVDVVSDDDEKADER